MSEYPHHESLRLQNFTAFADASFEFVPGINVFVGENGTGKTHAMKAMYAWQFIQNREDPGRTLFKQTFQADRVNDVIRDKGAEFTKAQVSGVFSGFPWEMIPQASPIEAGGGLTFRGEFRDIVRPIFVPAVDMIGHARKFGDYFDEFSLDFDYTYRDIVRLLNVERRVPSEDFSPILATLENKALYGSVEHDAKEDRFFLVQNGSRRPMPLVAEVLRKIATLYTLIRNGSIKSGTTLFWDEPEVNLNPVLMDEVVGALLALARSGVQVFLATHSYVILKELDLQSKSTEVRYFSFRRSDEGTTVTWESDFGRLDPNPILDQYDKMLIEDVRRSGSDVEASLQ